MSSITATQRRRILERDGHRCLKCGSRANLTMDHVIPQAKGGHSYDVNVQTLCLDDNNAKADDIAYYGRDSKVFEMIESYHEARKNCNFGNKYDPNKIDRARRHAEEVVRQNKMMNGR